MHGNRCGWLKAKLKSQARNIRKYAIVGQPCPGDASWLEVPTQGVRALLPEKAARTGLKKGEELLEATCNRGARVLWQQFATKVLKPGIELQPTDPCSSASAT